MHSLQGDAIECLLENCPFCDYRVPAFVLARDHLSAASGAATKSFSQRVHRSKLALSSIRPISGHLQAPKLTRKRLEMQITAPS